MDIKKFFLSRNVLYSVIDVYVSVTCVISV